MCWDYEDHEPRYSVCLGVCQSVGCLGMYVWVGVNQS